jgi:hypothetical protein
MTLRLPSELLQSFNLSTLEELGLHACKQVAVAYDKYNHCLEEKEFGSTMFARSFRTEELARYTHDRVREQVGSILEGENVTTRAVILFPLLLRSNQTCVIHVSQCVMLVLFDNGPIVPIVCVHEKDGCTNPILAKLYLALDKEFVTVERIQQIIVDILTNVYESPIHQNDHPIMD